MTQESESQMTETSNVVQRAVANVSLQHHNTTHPICTNCGCFGASSPPPPLPPPPLPLPSTGLHNHPLKRRSPEPTITATTGTTAVSDPQEPRNKKLFLDNQQTHSGHENSNLLGFTRISLPDSFPVLRRCASDPCNPLQSPTENSLRRSVSDPIPSPAKSYSRSNERGVAQSPNSMKLNKMKEGLKEMTMWCEELLHQQEEGAAAEENSHNNAEKVHCGAEYEEAVVVERRGDCLIINFKCPCGNGYHILLSGSSCYYKLI